MPQPKSKATKPSWANLLKAELGDSVSKFPPDAKTAIEIGQELKENGLPYGKSFVCAYLRKLVDAGRAKRYEGQSVKNGIKVRCTKYVLTAG